ncbi:phenoloxidase-activating factor 3-like [Photinus pyralis]|uniref:Peptidase S1 domain-containing protein n=1 Tax=Photinus pyralis TaxID=7054 RepID=A0A1Y1MGX4_PHOPY|nr:phenoloxidase-activating factor 3-like [Photinus pyralis]
MFLTALFLYVILNIIVPTLSETDLLASRTYCGLQHSDDYVKDNPGISLDEFPWITQLLYDEDKSVKCVGSLINRRYVLTAAQCMNPRDGEITGIRLGDYDITSDKDCVNETRFGEECSDPAEEFGIEELIPHPGYRARTAVNDIGLIRLSKNVDYSEYIRPICLPAATSLYLKDGVALAVSGWGFTQFGGESAKIKKKVSAQLLPLDTCRGVYNNTRQLITTNHLCVSEDKTTFTCQGDAGGPLMLSVKNQWEGVGVVSFGTYCGAEYPAVYTKVSSYLDWIRQNVRK